MSASTRAAFLGQSDIPRGEDLRRGNPDPTPSVASSAPAGASLAMVTPMLKPSGPKKRLIAIDPGHGGIDPGATGVSGVYEKNITMAVARAVKRRLQATGRYEVLLTRDRDVFVRLRDRVEIARKAGADLFLSIHADTIANKKIRGASVYTLSEKASDKEAAALAEQENKADLIAGVDLSRENPEVTNILIDLAQRETMNQSARFAGLLVGSLKRDVRLLRNSHRFAGFVVLKAPDIPSVLIELGFLSNRYDERLLRDRRHRAKLAGAITAAIDRYFARVEHAERS
jgi:N-acetylmuramoyl-L-alanine amidase